MLLTRVKMATLGACELAPVEDWYGNWLDYRVVERGSVNEELAVSWGAAEAAGSPYLLLAPKSDSDVYIRAVQTTLPNGYRGLTTFGWNAFELIVEDVYSLHARLQGSPFRIIGPPASLGGGLQDIHAMQVVGPSEDVLYLTCYKGSAEDSILPEPGAAVGRLFIAVVAGPDVWAIHDFYTKTFGMEPGEARDTSVEIVNHALGLPAGHKIGMTFVTLGEPGNFLEIDGYPAPAGARNFSPHTFPPGNGSVTFSVPNLDSLDLPWLSPPIKCPSSAYAGGRSACFTGPAGELVELVEERRAG